MAESPELRPREIIGRLVAAGVDFVVVGGIAVFLQGYERLTKDLDIAFASDQANLKALGQALTGLEAQLRGVDDKVPFVADEKTLDAVELLTLNTTAGALDVHKNLKGVRDYGGLRRRADRMDLDGASVLVASLDDLLAMKHAAGRPLDKVDIEALEEIKRQKARARRS